MLLGLPVLAAVTIAYQARDPRLPGQRPDPPPAPAPIPTSVAATRAVQPPVIDGRDDDDVWRQAQPITGFEEWRPSEGGPPKLPTEAKVAYDAGNLYVFVRAFDPHPDSIITVLARRDYFTPSDMIWLFLDSYHDRRTGYEFGVNPSGVKLDAQIYNDGNEDFAWDAVWDVATRRDSLGWTAEFRIPLSQLRYGREKSHTFGLTVDRDLYRYAQRVSWPVFRQSKAGFVSQFGEVTGLDDLEAPRRMEAAPYLVTKNVSQFQATGIGRTQDVTVGGDLKYRVASNLTLDATLNPDFGQVEADPGVLNLTAFETFFREQRPFFVQGAGIFRFDVNCTAVNDCGTGEGLVYSRRIGRAPELAGTYNDTTSPAFTRIIGAGKLTGRTPSGLTIGALEAVTEHVTGVGDKTIEPASNYGVLRLRQDLRGGESNVGAIFTAVNRDNDPLTAQYLRHNAYVAAADFRHRFPGARYEIWGSVDLSRVAGTRQAITATQQDAVHYYQRPDAGLPYDPTRTVLTGDAEELQFGKVGGAHLLFQTGFQRRSAGFEINDLGYLQRADQQTWSTWMGFFDRHKRALYQRFQWNFNWWQFWTAGGLPEERAFNTNTHTTFNNTWSFHTGFTLGQLGETYCYDCSRGGRAVRQDSYFAPWAGLNGDDRKAIVPYFWVNYWRGDGGRSHSLNLMPEVDFKLASRITAAVIPNYTRKTNDIQPRDPVTDAAGNVTHSVFSHLEQKQLGVTMRVTYPFSASMSLQVYAQPFVSKGTYTHLQELSTTPRAADYTSRYQSYTDSTGTYSTGFNYKQFRSNVVFRWEYRPGSTLFVVWSQGRTASSGAEGTRGLGGDLRDLFDLRPDNGFLVKLSYWINR
jgi:Domain of unknown function (DUF5916)/Carbohydrate family 9 binding domain-like